MKKNVFKMKFLNLINELIDENQSAGNLYEITLIMIK